MWQIWLEHSKADPDTPSMSASQAKCNDQQYQMLGSSLILAELTGDYKKSCFNGVSSIKARLKFIILLGLVYQKKSHISHTVVHNKDVQMLQNH